MSVCCSGVSYPGVCVRVSPPGYRDKAGEGGQCPAHEALYPQLSLTRLLMNISPVILYNHELAKFANIKAEQVNLKFILFPTRPDFKTP